MSSFVVSRRVGRKSKIFLHDQRVLMSMALVLSGVICLLVIAVFYVLMCTSKDSAPNRCFSNFAYVGKSKSLSVSLYRTVPFSDVVTNAPTNRKTVESRVPFGKEITRGAYRLYRYVFWERNPLLTILFVVLLVGAYFLGVKEIFPHVPSSYLPWWHKVSFSFVFFGTMTSFYLACTTPPGYITNANIRKYSKYPYDMMMYVPKTCRTTGILKPARSKYCSIMKQNVARFDHYCAWLAQPVGEDNYRTFLLFLFTTASMLAYATVAILLIVWSIVEENDLFNATFINRSTGQRFSATRMMVLQWVIARYNIMCAIGFMTCVMGIVVAAFLGYHLYLVSRNLTTNETFKWSDFKVRKKIPFTACTISRLPVL